MIESVPECSCSGYKNCPYSDYKCCIDSFSDADKQLLHKECRMMNFLRTREASIVLQNLKIYYSSSDIFTFQNLAMIGVLVMNLEIVNVFHQQVEVKKLKDGLVVQRELMLNKIHQKMMKMWKTFIMKKV